MRHAQGLTQMREKAENMNMLYFLGRSLDEVTTHRRWSSSSPKPTTFWRHGTLRSRTGTLAMPAIGPEQSAERSNGKMEENRAYHPFCNRDLATAALT